MSNAKFEHALRSSNCCGPLTRKTGQKNRKNVEIREKNLLVQCTVDLRAEAGCNQTGDEH
jgi:hypothetical protein